MTLKMCDNILSSCNICEIWDKNALNVSILVCNDITTFYIYIYIQM